MTIGEEIILNVEHILTKASGDDLAFLEFEAMDIPRINEAKARLCKPQHVSERFQ